MEQKARVILNALDCPDGELSILIVDDSQIAEFNQEYLNRSGPTNVIAFPMQSGEFADVSPELLGDVVVSAETAHRESEDAGIEWITRFDQLIVHGILHLFGYDHVNSEPEAERMEKKSRELMELIVKE
ncbi:rRNA maturation RNase YbeY [Thermodesulfobacteriota bacterium]